MSTTQRMMKSPMAVSAAGLIAALGFSMTVNAVAIVAAEEVTQLIHFDDLPNSGFSNYTTADGNFYFEPTNFQSSSSCAEEITGGNRRCLIEVSNGDLTDMTRLTGDKTFSLDSFYFNLQGGGPPTALNSIIVTDNNNITTSFKLGMDYGSIVTFYDGALAGQAAGVLAKGTGYIADMTGFGGFSNITKIMFDAASTNQVRLDCIVTTFEGSTDEPASDFDIGCGGGGTVTVPEPGTLALLGLGLLGLATARRGA